MIVRKRIYGLVPILAESDQNSALTNYMVDDRNSFSKRMFGYAKQSGPGWIQAAVTLGGGTLVSALYLGVVGGFEFLWLQPLAMLCGIVMLSALSHITLSSSERPFRLAKHHVSPTLAWGWLIATIIANVVFCAAQFALGTDAIQGNLGLKDVSPYLVTSFLFIISASLIWYFSGEGRGAKIIDYIIKGLVSLIVLAFMGVVVTLSISGAIDWGALFGGLIPNFAALFEPTESYNTFLIQTGEYQAYWSDYISSNQRNIIIGAFGTAVGINMTFLLPYTLLKKGWGKAQRELARFDLFLGLFVPFILGSSCLIIASASQFHANKNAIVNETAYNQVLDNRLSQEHAGYIQLSNIQKTELRSTAPSADKNLSTMLAKRNANDLATALEPFLGKWAQLIFGIGILAMALSTMIVHMMMNGYAISEAMNQVGNRKTFFLGGLIPAFMGLISPIIWAGSVKSALIVPASVIATTLLPIAYLVFVLLMNSRKALRDEMPQKRGWINILMIIATAIATFASVWALVGKYESTNVYEKYFGLFGLIGLITLGIIGILGFIKREKR